MPTKKTDALSLLLSQHREAEKLLATLEVRRQSGEETLRQLAHTVSLQMTVKQRVFFPQLAPEDLDWQFSRTLEDHLATRRTLSELLCLDLAGPLFQDKLSLLKAQLRQQFREEEEDLFPQVKAALTKTQLSELANNMKKLAKQLSAVETTPAAWPAPQLRPSHKAQPCIRMCASRPARLGQVAKQAKQSSQSEGVR